MPTYQQAHLIGRALESLLAQTLTSWELVIVDDGSPESTCQAVEAYLTNPRVRYYRVLYFL